MGLLARRLAGPAAGLLAALLVAVDPLHVHYSRQAVHDVYMFLFGAAGVLLALEYAASGRRRALAAAGVAFGLGLASKWAVLAPLVVTAGWLCARALRSRASRRAVSARLALILGALGAVPLAVYLVSWGPWFAHGRDLSDWLALQGAMASEARTHVGFNPVDLGLPHRAVRWFLWPTWFADVAVGPQGPVRLVAVTNPLVWLLVLPSVAVVAWRAFRLRREEDTLLAALFGATWLPFVLASRPIWLHSALAVMPFALAAVASAAVHLAGRAPGARRRLGTYAAVVAICSLPLLALATGFGGATGPMRELAKRFRPRVPIGSEAAGQAPPSPVTPSGAPAP
jgi:dolichyl-phosphate-mannose--protein O-mannosyl transferase